MEVMKGALDGLLGKKIAFEAEVDAGAKPAAKAGTGAALETADIKFGYCTEFIINSEKRIFRGPGTRIQTDIWSPSAILS